MKKAFALTLTLLLAVLTGCGAAGTAPPSPEPTPAPTPPVQEYEESDPITVTVTPVELTEEEQEISYLSSRIGDEVHMYELEAEGEITGAVARVFSLEDGAWVHCTAGFAFDLADGRFSVVSSGLSDGATVNFTTPSGVLSSAGAPGFEPPDAGFYLYGALGRRSPRRPGRTSPSPSRSLAPTTRRRTAEKSSAPTPRASIIRRFSRAWTACMCCACAS